MSNTTCQSVLKVLAAQNGCIRDRIINVPGLSKYAIVTNLRLLKKAGLINGSLKANDLHYCINYARLEELKTIFDSFYSALVKNKQQVNPAGNPCSAKSQSDGSN